MAKLLLGKPVAEAICADLQRRTAALAEGGVTPTLGILRLGANPSDLSYERGILKRAEQVGAAIQKMELPTDAAKAEVLAAIDRLNADPDIHGVLLLRPLPGELRAEQGEICNRLDPRKDVDGMTRSSAAGIFEGTAGLGFAPCTPAACLEILDYYGIACRGKRAAVIGRSMVVGRPAAMLLLARDATPTLCHTKTADTAAICREADIVITAAGVLNSLTRDFVRPGQAVLDVSINWDENKVNAKGTLGGIAGDANFDEVAEIVDAITPVPGGVGAVTTSVLMKHVVEAAERRG